MYRSSCNRPRHFGKLLWFDERASSWEEVMKARLSSTIWMLVFGIGVALLGVLGLAYHAGKESGGLSLADAASLPPSASGALLGAFGLVIVAAVLTVFVLSKRVLKPVGELAKFSERL